MSRDDTPSRRDVLRTTGGFVGAGALGVLAGCTGGGGGDGGDGDDGGGTPTGTDDGGVEAVSIGGTPEPDDGTETAESTEGGGGETARIQFLSGLAAESATSISLG